MKVITEIKIYCSLYDAGISFLFGGLVPDVVAMMKDRHGEDFKEKLDEDTDGYQFSILETSLGAGERFYVWIHKPTWNLLYHETEHLTFQILRHRGVEYSESCEDVFCYLGGAIFEELCSKILLLPLAKELYGRRRLRVNKGKGRRRKKGRSLK